MPETWWEYVTRISDGAQQKDIGRAAGVHPSQVSRWSDGDNPSPKHVIQFARHYKQPPLDALIAAYAQYLNADEMKGVATLDLSVRDMSADALALEIGHLVTELRRRVPTMDQRQDWGEADGWVGNPPMFQQHPTMRRRQS